MICRAGFRVLTRNNVILSPSYRRTNLPIAFDALRVHAPRSLARPHSSPAIRQDLEGWRLDSSKNASDTIYALSTAPGRAAIAIVRISGPACIDIYSGLCPHRPLPKPRTAAVRRLYDPDNLQSSAPRVLDTGALVLFFPAPDTVTGEDVLELHVHGGPAIVRSILKAISKRGRLLDGRGGTVRHAEPGEFTKWAFYNGRLDLTQAEALGETLAAETEQQRRLAVGGADGGLAKRYEEWRTMLLYARGELEALIDFSEDQHFDESPVEFMASVSTQISALTRQIEIHLQNASKGELLRSGIGIALLGAPNAGKSSLLNRIVGREAAIVTSEEGTTRDIVDVAVDLDGWLCRLGDMAGLRSSGNGGGDGQNGIGLVEQEGMRRARERALQSDVIVVLLAIERNKDGNVEIPVNAQVLQAVEECHAAGKTILVALNKIDLVGPGFPDEEAARILRTRVHEALPMVPDDRICLVSCKEDAAAGATTTTTTSLISDAGGGIQSFLARLTAVFSEMTAASTGEEDAGRGNMTAAEAQSYWSASLSVTHRQGTYLEECLHHLRDFLDQVPSSHPQKQTQTGFSDSSSNSAHGGDRPDDLGDPNIDRRDEVDIVTAAEHLRYAATCLAKITGKGEGGDVEDVLGVVFEK